MVSLSPGFNASTAQGARFFNEGSNMDEERLLEPILSSEQENTFQPLNTIPAFSFQLLVSTLISITGIVLAAVWKEDKRCEAYFIMFYLHAAFWLLSFVIDHLVHLHHDALRMRGYLDFHRTTSLLHRQPFHVVSLWTATLLAVQALMHHYYGDDFMAHCVTTTSLSPLSPATYIAMFLTLESIVLAGVNGSYIYRVVLFNRAQPTPDALKGELGGLQGAAAHGGSVGYAQRGGHLAELLEKQADLIHYLQDHNSKLSQKLMILNSQINSRSGHSNM